MVNKQLLLSKVVAAGMTQSQIAKKIGISLNSFNSKVNGKGFFSTEDVINLCDALSIDNDRDKVAIFLS